MLTTHEKDTFRKQLTDILGLPAGSSEKDGKFVIFWNENHASFDVIVYPNGNISIYTCNVRYFNNGNVVNPTPNEVIECAKAFKREIGS